MDLNDFWQESKQWLLGCAIGFLVFLIGYTVIDRLYNAKGRELHAAAASVQRRLVKDPMYQQQQQQQAQERFQELDRTLNSLREAMHFDLPERFDLKGKGDAELHWSSTYGAVRQALYRAANELNIDFPEDAFTWSAPTERDEIQRALVGASMVELAVQHLLAAHKTVTGKSYEALGLRAILDFKMDRRSRSRGRSKKPGERPTAEELVEETRVRFKFEADNATVHQFVENCRVGRPRLQVATLKITRGRRSGDPLTVTGELRTLRIKSLEEGS
ncbi:MAG: hypothetical protein KDC87_09615 [Planctomycetes bacterium]|nr:hypothetical protein [Planctomycetota bacterium]MCB9868601.1 hypothetical protein [Planctomycetota bacterium]MCB9889235.1 hypothetical protein [Planctomycetota bacterium]